LIFLKLISQFAVNEWENDRDILLILATLEGLDQLLGFFS